MNVYVRVCMYLFQKSLGSFADFNASNHDSIDSNDEIVHDDNLAGTDATAGVDAEHLAT